MRRIAVSLASLVAVATLACGSSGSGFADGGAGDDARTDGTAGDGAIDDGGLVFESGEAGGCNAPDMLIVLDRTLSMSRAPNGSVPANNTAGHALTKWVLATKAVKLVTTPPLDQSVRFGL